MNFTNEKNNCNGINNMKRYLTSSATKEIKIETTSTSYIFPPTWLEELSLTESNFQIYIGSNAYIVGETINWSITLHYTANRMKLSGKADQQCSQ